MNKLKLFSFVRKLNIIPFSVLCLGLVLSPSAAYSKENDWQPLSPNDPKSDELDLPSLNATGTNTYTARYRQQEFSTDAYNLMGVKVPPGGVRITYITGQCMNGATMIETQVELVSPAGLIIHSEKSDDDFKATQAEFNDRYLKGTYQENIGSLACAALAAQCAGRKLQWPLPHIENAFKPSDKNPLYGWMDIEAAPTASEKETDKTASNLTTKEEAKVRQLYMPDCKAGLEQINR